ncbi:hypothetical protein KUTeg_015905 [Tegillarca granosa]|uniref:Rapamycin-insensitive companion of mTOR n=1 Tax=Tegillarca granosa TaxID=220873 RepID=A0ABQ9EJJ5_TEGGR|nr:hypothetical protein KUTeg_015905 [Tegillarca granosa]
MAIVTIMRSWPGIIRFCRPDGSGLQSLIGILYLPYTEIREGIVEILFDIFRLQTPTDTDDIAIALLSVDPSEMRENWQLTDGFVAEEGRELLPHMAKIRPNLVENHLALLLSAWIGAGLLGALVEVIITSEPNLFIRTTVLLGKLLHLASTLMPHECSQHNYCLPTLVALASSQDASSRQRHRAREAVYYLDRLHTLRKRGLVPCSLFLDQLIQRTSGRKATHTKSFHINKDKLQDTYLVKVHHPHEDLITQSIKDSQVLNTKDSINWDWDLIGAILKFTDEKIRKLDDQLHIRYIKRLVYFFKPTNHLFSRLEMTNERSEKIAYIGCQLVDFLIESDQEEASKLITEFLNDIGQCLSEIAMQHIVPESVLSPSNVINTCSRYYFLYLGRFSATARGDRYLEKTGIFQYLLDIVGITNQDCYIKVITSSLNYSREGNTRPILAKALCSSTESSRLYCTNLLRVLLRIGVQGFSNWGMELLVGQLYDQSKPVAMAALNVMEESCDVETCLNSLVKLRPSCLHLGEKGVLMLCRFISTTKGFRSLMEANYLNNELQKWYKSFNCKYVLIVEELLNEALTTYEKTYEGSYTRRSSQRRPKKDAFLPVHLYGQLTQHKEGFHLLQSQEYMEEYFQCIRTQVLVTDQDVLMLKTALWAVGHIGSSSWGVNWLDEEKLLPEIVRLAEECGVFSIRGTSFYVLGLIASTREGAEYLTQLGWESCWNTREERWPVIEDKTLLLADIDDTMSESNYSVFSGSKSEFDQRSHQSPGVMSTSLFFIEEEEKLSSKESGCDTDILTCDNNNSIKSSPITIPKKSGFIGRSKTLPLESTGFRRFKSLPIRPHTFRGFMSLSSNEDRYFKEDFNVHKRDKHTDTIHQQSTSLDEKMLTRTEIPVTSKGEISNVISSIPVIRLTASDKEKNSSGDKSSKSSAITLQEEDEEEEEELGIKFSVEESKKSDSLDSKTPRAVEQFIKRSPNLKEGRSSSSDSSRTSKSRADSFNTDSTTSGISSCESGPTTCFSSDVISLSPIASSTTIDTVGLSQLQNLDTRDFIHPSTVRRKSLNLSRVPSVRKQQGSSAYGILSSSKLLEGYSAENAIVYTTNRDALGYATWRSIRRQRAVSSDVESDLGIDNLFDEENIGFRSRRSSIESKKSVDTYNFRLSGLPRNSSAVSLPDQDSRPSSPYSTTTKTILHCRKPHTGEAEFHGLTLPVDINMLFQVHEGEDKRCQSVSLQQKSKRYCQENGG